MEIIFRVPTGCGKSHMMADVMSKVLGQEQEICTIKTFSVPLRLER